MPGIKKVLLYSDCFIYSGSENVIENLIRSSKLNEKYTFCFFFANSKKYREGVENKINKEFLHPLPIKSSYNEWGYQFYNSPKKSRQYYYLLLRYAVAVFFRIIGMHNLQNSFILYNTFRKTKPNILYINNGGYPGAASCRIAAIMAKAAGVKKIVFNVNNLAQPQKNWLDKLLDKLVNKSVNVFTTASKAALEKLILERKFDSTKCLNIPNTLTERIQDAAVNLKGALLRKEFNIENETVVIGTVGLLTQRKGFTVLIDAAQKLSKLVSENLKFCIVIFGEGELRSILEQKIADYNLQHIVLMPGFRNNILEYVKSFDVFVSPSVSNEDFPYVIIEAMMLEKPVVGTNIAGIPEQVETGINGYITQPGNDLQMAEALALLIENEELRVNMGQNSKKRYLNKFSNSIIIEQFIKLFESSS